MTASVGTEQLLGEFRRWEAAVQGLAAWYLLLILGVTLLLGFFAWCHLPRSSVMAAWDWRRLARTLYPIRQMQLMTTSWGLLLGCVWITWLGRPEALVPSGVLVAVWVLSVLVGVGLSQRWIGRRLAPVRSPAPDAPRDSPAAAHLWMGLPGLIIIMSFALIPGAGLWMAGAILVLAWIALALAATDGRARVARLFGGAIDPPVSLSSSVQRLANRAGVAVPPVTVVKLQTAQAFAKTLARGLFFTTGMLHLLDEGELEAIAAHELGHLTHSRRAATGGLLVEMSWVLVAAAPVVYGVVGWGPAIVLPIFLFSFGGWLHGCAAADEVHADAMVAKLGIAPEVWRRALLKLYEAELIPEALAAGPSPHPPLAERIGETDSDRPVEVARVAGGWALATAALVLACCVWAWPVSTRLIGLADPVLAARADVSVAGDASAVAGLAVHLARDGRVPEARGALDHALRLDRMRPEVDAARCLVAAEEGRAGVARIALAEAEEAGLRGWRWWPQRLLGLDPLSDQREAVERLNRSMRKR